VDAASAPFGGGTLIQFPWFSSAPTDHHTMDHWPNCTTELRRLFVCCHWFPLNSCYRPCYV